MAITKWENTTGYTKQSALVAETLRRADHSLDGLLAAMRLHEESALYLAGTRLDNKFCFGSEDLGTLLSIMPEGAEKAGEPGYHPGSTEVYITFQGSLTLQCLDEGRVAEKSSSAQEIVVLPPGQCHRVKTSPAPTAASLVAKTNLRHKPGVIRCGECTYFAEPRDCPLHRTWKREQP